MHKITSVHDINTPMLPMCDRTPNWQNHPPHEVYTTISSNEFDRLTCKHGEFDRVTCKHGDYSGWLDWSTQLASCELPLLVHQRLRLGSMVGELGAYTQRWYRFQITCFVDQKGIDNRPLISTNDIYTCRHNTTYSTTFARKLGTIPVALRRMKFELYSDDLDHQRHTTCVNLGMYGWRTSTRCPTDSSLRIAAYITNHYAMIANVCIQWKEIDRLW